MPKLINKFYGGIARDEKTKSVGVASNIEEIDILENADFIQATQIMTSDAMPSNTEVYAYCSDNADTVFGYGKRTDNSNEVRIVSLTQGGLDDPGAFATLMTSADTTNDCYQLSPIEYHSSDTGDANRLYYLTKNSTTITLKHCKTDGTSETTDGTLTGLDGSGDRLFMRRIYGSLFVGNGQYISKVDKSGAFTEKAFTLPSGWIAVDMCEAGSSSLILARNINSAHNITKAFFWDLTSLTQFDDSFDIPFGGPQWIIKHRETIKILCAINGKAKIFQISAYAGGVPSAFPNMELSNIAIETNNQPISSQRMVSIKDDIVYFGLWKTDKTAIYGLGQIDNNKPYALWLAKRYDTSNYANHTPYALFIDGPNFFGAFSDNGTADHCRCETRNSPTRSSNAVYETIVIDDELQSSLGKLEEVFVTTKPLGGNGTKVNISIDPNYSGTYTQIYQSDGTTMQNTSDTIGVFKPKLAEVKVFKIKMTLESNGTTSPKVTGIGWNLTKQGTIAMK